MIGRQPNKLASACSHDWDDSSAPVDYLAFYRSRCLWWDMGHLLSCITRYSRKSEKGRWEAWEGSRLAKPTTQTVYVNSMIYSRRSLPVPGNCQTFRAHNKLVNPWLASRKLQSWIDRLLTQQGKWVRETLHRPDWMPFTNPHSRMANRGQVANPRIFLD